jgi:threonyl-tRNA synthetase
LLEHYGGALPLWLSPVQLKILAVSDKFLDYARRVHKEAVDAGIRAEIDDRSEKIGYKIRDAELLKVPFMVIVGEKEQQAGTVSVRMHGKGDQGSIPLNQFIIRLQQSNKPGINIQNI